MVQGQRRNHHFLALFHLTFQHRPDLRQVGHQVGVSQHGTLGNTSGTAGVLQHGQIIQLDIDRGKLFTGTGAEYRRQLMSTRNVERRNHLLQVLHRGIHQGTLDGGMHIGNLGHDHVLDAGMGQHLLRVVRHISQNNQCLCARIVKLVLHLTSGVQGVGVHHNQTSAHGPEHNHRILGNVRHLHRNAVARFQVGFVLQPGREVAALSIKIPIGQGNANCCKRRLVCKLLYRLLKNIHHVLVFIEIDFPGDASWVFVLIELLKIHHHLLSDWR